MGTVEDGGGFAMPKMNEGKESDEEPREAPLGDCPVCQEPFSPKPLACTTAACPMAAARVAAISTLPAVEAVVLARRFMIRVPSDVARCDEMRDESRCPCPHMPSSQAFFEPGNALLNIASAGGL